jgi:hypothetical protein
MHATAERKKLHLLTVAEYMTLETPARTELLGGVIFAVSPKNVAHSRAVAALAKALNRGLPDSYSVLIQDPVAVSGWTGRDAPEIDRKAADAFAFIEVADATYGGRRGDRRYKIPLYVRAGVPAWIVNLRTRRVECYSSPADLALPHGREVCEGETFDVLGVSIAVSDLF